MAALEAFTVRDALAAAGVNDDDIFQNQTPAERMAEDMFQNDFVTCMDKSMEELESDFKSYSTLTQNQGQIRLLPGVKSRIKAFIQWTREEIRMGRDPSQVAFPVIQTPTLLRRLKTHDLYVTQSRSLPDAAKPSTLTGDTKWTDWQPTFENYLRLIPGRDGVPLSYVIRRAEEPNPMPLPDVLDMYVNCAPLRGEAFNIDRSKVATILQGLIVGNSQAEMKVQTVADKTDGRVLHATLHEHFLGVGVYANEVTEAERIIANLFYAGEKKPHMWWEQFERQLLWAYATMDRIEGRQVHSNDQKLRMLVHKIKADFLGNQLASINTELAKVPMIYTFEMAVKAIRMAVNMKHPPQMSHNAQHTPRHVRQLQQGRGRGGRGGRGGRSGHGRGGRGGGQRHVTRTRTDSEIVQLNDGKWIEYHPSFNFTSSVFGQFPQELRDKLKRQRAEYRRNRDGRRAGHNTDDNRHIQELRAELQDLRSQVSANTTTPPPQTIATDALSRVSQVTTGTQGQTMMGGRNEQAQRHQDRHIRKLSTIGQVRVSSLTITPAFEAPANTVAINETDNNADTVVLGRNFALLELSRRVADVYPFDPTMNPTEIPIGTGVTAYDYPDGTTILLIVHEGLWYGSKLDHSLWNPNQLRHYGINYWDNPFDTQHDLCIEIDDNYKIPLVTQGTKVQFQSRVPTPQELSNPQIPRFEMTSKNTWEPTQVRLSQASTISSHHQRHPLPWSRTIQAVESPTAIPIRGYLDPRSTEAILHSIDPLLVNLNEGRKVAPVTYDPHTYDVPVRRTFVSNERHVRTSAEELSERFGIGIQRARSTLSATLQLGTRSAILPLERRYRADRRFERRRLSGKFSTDTAYFPVKSLRGNIASQIYYDKCGFAACYHVPRVNDQHVGSTLPSFSSDYGVPEYLTMDGANVQIGRNTEFQAFIRRNEIKFHVSHPRRPNENPAEGGIREIKQRFYRFVQKYTIPMRLWDFVLDYVIDVMNVTVNGSRYSQQRTPLEIITGITPDISELLDFNIYDWVYYRTNAGLGPRLIGRWLGVSHRRGPMLTYWILPHSGIPISCDSVQRVTNAERETDTTKLEMTAWTNQVTPRLQADAGTIQVEAVPQHLLFDLQNEDEDFAREFNRVIDDPTLPHADVTTTQGQTLEVEHDNYINMEVGLRRGAEGELQRATVKRRAVDVEGQPIGNPHGTGNPLLDTRQYDVEYEDGTSEILAANILAENILSQVDEEGYRHLMMDEIVEHRVTSDAIPKSQGTYQTTTGATRRVHTTRGWQFYVAWKDGSGNWIELKDLRESYPVEVAEYARDNGLLDEPAFAWWAAHALKKRDRIIAKVKSKYWDRTHKYGIRVPRSVDEAKQIDQENGDDLWMTAIRKEMAAVRIAFEEHQGDPKDLVGYEQITGHLVFDVKLGENFRRKARYCADGHKTRAPASITYSSVVSRDSVRIMLLVAALNDLSVRAADVQNAFLTAPNLERNWMRAGPEFGADEGKIFIVRRALYGLKSASAAFRSFLAEKLEMIGFKSTIADPDVWRRPAVKPDGTKYYEYVLAYVDDLLAIGIDPDAIMAQIGERFRFKNDEVKEPETYLGARLQKKTMDGVEMWTMSSVDYVRAALKNVQEQLKGTRWSLPTKVTTPMTTNYQPELDTSPELDDNERTRFQELIGIIRWATEIGRVDVLHEVSLLSQYQAAPREEHFAQLLHIFAFWKANEKLSIYFDPRLPNIDYSDFVTNREDFKIHYRDSKEELPHDMPIPRGRPVQITAFVDASHAANKKTRRSHTGYVVFLNRAPILWYSKRQNTVEASTFSSEFIALKSCVEAITHLRYKLRMFGVPLCGQDVTATEEHEDDPAHVFCDNESVVKNSTLVESTLNKKHSSLAYHYVRWNVAAGIVSLAWISTHENLADAFSKRLAAPTRNYLFGNWTY